MAKKRGMSRRDFFRNTWLASMGVSLAGFGGASIAFVWPSLRGGFGAKLNLGKVEDLKRELGALPGGMKYFAEARTYLVLYNGNDDAGHYDGGFLGEGLLAVYQKCAHLGCRVPFCESSKWFECPCHGSRYNKAGEYQFGPAPHSLWHFPILIESGNVTVDTAAPGAALARGVDTIRQEPEGPHC